MLVPLSTRYLQGLIEITIRHLLCWTAGMMKSYPLRHGKLPARATHNSTAAAKPWKLGSEAVQPQMPARQVDDGRRKGILASSLLWAMPCSVKRACDDWAPSLQDGPRSHVSKCRVSQAWPSWNETYRDEAHVLPWGMYTEYTEAARQERPQAPNGHLRQGSD